MPYIWKCPKCGWLVMAKSLYDVYDSVQLHIVYSHKEGFIMRRISRTTIDLGEYGTINFTTNKILYELYNNPQTHKQLITYMRENHLLKSKP